MFHFPTFASPCLCIQHGIPTLFTSVGFPIRTSPDQRLVGNSPELFAATHVLHRLSAPRHPPHALSSLLASISHPTSSAFRPGLLKLETKVQVSALRGRPKRVGTRRLSTTMTLIEIDSYPSYPVFKERLGLLLPAIPVELIGIEPTTSSLQSWRSPS
jgi:hypothetical protein